MCAVRSDSCELSSTICRDLCAKTCDVTPLCACTPDYDFIDVLTHATGSCILGATHDNTACHQSLCSLNVNI